MRLNTEVYRICKDFCNNHIYKIELEGLSISLKTISNLRNKSNCSVATATKIAYIFHIPIEDVIDLFSVGEFSDDINRKEMIYPKTISELQVFFRLSKRTIERYVSEMEQYSHRYGSELIISGVSRVSAMALLDYYINRQALNNVALYSDIILPYNGMRLYNKIN